MMMMTTTRCPLPILLICLLAAACAACDEDDDTTPRDLPDATDEDTVVPGDDAVHDVDDGDTTRPDSSDDTDDDTAVPGDTGQDLAPDVPIAPSHLSQLAVADDFVLLASADDVVKYLFNADGATPVEPLTDPCTFQNTLRYEYHIQFLRSLPELASLSFDDYTAWVLRDETRVWFGGALHRFPRTPHPRTAEPGVVAYTLYSDPGAQSAPSLEQILEVDARARQCVTFAADTLVYLPADPWQQDAARIIENELNRAGVDVLYPGQIIR